MELVRPVIEDWLDRAHGVLTFRLVQVLSEHGSFGKYLCSIGREPTTECHHCGCCQDMAQHTVEECPGWVNKHRDLAAAVGDDLSLPAQINAEKRQDVGGNVILLRTADSAEGSCGAGAGNIHPPPNP